MLAAALLASLWAQAEPAPPEPPAPPPIAAPSPPPPTAAAVPATPSLANGVSFHLRYAYRLGTEGDATGPAAGISLGGAFEHRLRAFQTGIEVGLGFDFFYDRFSKQVAALSTDPSGAVVATVVDRTLSETSFALMPTIAWRRSDNRIFVGFGGGVTVGYFVSPDLFSGSRTAVQRLGRAVGGMDFALSATTAAILRVDYGHSFDHESYGTSLLFGDIVDVGAGLLARF
jgi:hypothetical protein